MLQIKSRLVFLLTFLYITGLILFALYLQYFQDLSPCPLCMLQRIIFITMAVVALLAVLHNSNVLGIRIYSVINSLLAICGISLAGRHMWLISLPPELAPECGPSFDIMMEYLPITEVLKKAIMGTGDCAKIDWTFLNLSIADWSFLCFGFLLVVNLFLLIKPNK